MKHHPEAEEEYRDVGERAHHEWRIRSRDRESVHAEQDGERMHNRRPHDELVDYGEHKVGGTDDHEGDRHELKRAASASELSHVAILCFPHFYSSVCNFY